MEGKNQILQNRYPSEFYDFGFKEFYPKANYVSLKSNLCKAMISDHRNQQIVRDYFNNKHKKNTPLYQYFFEQVLNLDENQERYDEYYNFYSNLPFIHASRNQDLRTLQSYNKRGGNDNLNSTFHHQSDLSLGRGGFNYFGLGFLHQSYLKGCKQLFLFEPSKLINKHNITVQGLQVFPTEIIRNRNKHKNTNLIEFQDLLDQTMEYSDFLDLLCLYSVFYENFSTHFDQHSSTHQVLTEVMIQEDVQTDLAEIVLKVEQDEPTIERFIEIIKNNTTEVVIPKILLDAICNNSVIFRIASNNEKIFKTHRLGYHFLNFEKYKGYNTIRDKLVHLSQLILSDLNYKNIVPND